MKEVYLSSNLVRQALIKFDVQSSMGPDGIHLMLLMRCAAELAYPLFVIMERSLLSGQLPLDWKTSIVIPIFKNKNLIL